MWQLHALHSTKLPIAYCSHKSQNRRVATQISIKKYQQVTCSADDCSFSAMEKSTI